jgi:calcineurin-like phosphoesterase family protein
MSNIWFTTDPHLFHRNILTFTDSNTGNLIRPGFANIEEMNDCILTCHNERVKPFDKVYWLGDIAFRITKEFRELFHQFHGKHRLIPGNHDPIDQLVPFFEKTNIWRVFREDGIIPFTCSHIPLHLSSVKGIFNVHGHIHQNASPTINHINICPEVSNYYPWHFDELQAEMKDRMRRGAKYEGPVYAPRD